MSADWRRVSELFEQATARPPGERDAFVREACAGDAGLEREVRSLLEHHRDDETFLAPGAGLRLPGEDALPGGALREGGRIGAWRLVRPLGEGGMGTVWLVERADGQFAQRGALKVIRHGFASEEMVRRFRRERRILAALDHPNIARLLDGGSTPEGLPYLVMDYVEGEFLYGYCTDRARSLPERLRLFLALCAAVQYAHGQLVLHRDLKPGNVVVAPDGTPRLLDFGVAKVVDEARAAEDDALKTVSLPLTPEYASPEQLRGEEATVASDVYSLGVLLYELLTGAHPYAVSRGAPSALVREVLEREPARPSSRSAAPGPETGSTLPPPPGADATPLRRRLEGDLDTIVLKAMQKDPARRYASVEQLADDVRRHLGGHPVLARPDAWGYRAGKFARRNRVAVALGSLALLALLAGLAVALWQAQTARRESAIALRRLRDVQSLANTLLFDVYDRLENVPNATPVRASVVRTAAVYLDSLAADASADSSLRFTLADAYERLGTAQRTVREGDPARSFARAIALREGLLREYPDNEHALLELIQGYTRLGAFDEMNNSYPAALAFMQKAAECNERLVAKQPGNASYRAGLPKRYNNLGNALIYNGREVDALVPLRKAMAGFATLSGAAPDNVEWQRLLGMSTTLYDDCLIARGGDPDSAIAIERRALELYAASAKREPDNLDLIERVADAHERLGQLFAQRAGRPDSAVAHLEEAQRWIERFAASDPENRDGPMEAAGGNVVLGLALAMKSPGRGPEAAHADAVLARAAAKLPGWWRTDSSDSRLVGLRPLLELGLAIAAEHRAQAASGAGAARAWKDSRVHADLAAAFFADEAHRGTWEMAGDDSIAIQRVRAESDSALAVR
ncbi:MAG TPA: serine/threonine-protein kinase [Candidatus Acidoferrales bacterium]|nr:serine/threonine-protein kinase [Candidatus Acidoferrales bacterium]